MFLRKIKNKLLTLLLAGILAASVGCEAEVSNHSTAVTGRELQDDLAVDDDAGDELSEDSDEDPADEPDLSEIPAYSSAAYAIVNDNVPFFTEDEITTEPFENYSDLDELGRCQVAFANICRELMPTEERGKIGQIKPSGWQTVKYNGYVDGNYLYNRCHLIGYQLAGENANEKNLITGTRYMNVEGMLPFENDVADYIDEYPDRHVLYRVTPIFTDDHLLADGVLMEAYSVEDQGAGVEFCVFCYNVQPGIIIDYANGDSSLDENYAGAYAVGSSFDNDSGDDKSENTYVAEGQGEDKEIADETTYVVNTNTGKFHDPDCSSVRQMASRNVKEVTASRDTLIDEGYSPCGNCNP